MHRDDGFVKKHTEGKTHSKAQLSGCFSGILRTSAEMSMSSKTKLSSPQMNPRRVLPSPDSLLKTAALSAADYQHVSFIKTRTQSTHRHKLVRKSRQFIQEETLLSSDSGAGKLPERRHTQSPRSDFSLRLSVWATSFSEFMLTQQLQEDVKYFQTVKSWKSVDIFCKHIKEESGGSETHDVVGMIDATSECAQIHGICFTCPTEEERDYKN